MAEYIERRKRGEKVVLKELAEQFGVSYGVLRGWKKRDRWDSTVPPPERKCGAPYGNQNHKGHRNAAGHHAGAPKGNRNAEKDGAYSTIRPESLSEDERALMDETPTDVRAALEQEMRILKVRECRILKKIAEYESADQQSTYLSTVTEISGSNESVMRVSDSAFKRVQSLQEALYKVHGRIAKITDSLYAMDEADRRFGMEQQRLDIMRMRATGSVEVDDIEEA